MIHKLSEIKPYYGSWHYQVGMLKLIRVTFIGTAVMCNLRVSAGEHEELHSMQLNVSSNGHGM